MSYSFHPAKLSENHQLSFYGALFAVAKADGEIALEESQAIFKTIDYTSLSDATKQEIQSYIQHPPCLEKCLDQLQGAEDNLRWGLLFYLIYVAWADKEITPEEEKAIYIAKEKFNVTNSQLEALQNFVQRLLNIRESKLNAKDVVSMSKEAAISILSKQEIPVLDFFVNLSIEKPIVDASLYTEEGFWRKLKKFALVAGKEVIEKVLLLFYAAQQPNVPIKIKSIIFGSLAYFILPFDAIPDIVPVVGFGDDLAALAAAIAVCTFYITPEVKENAKQKMNDLFGI